MYEIDKKHTLRKRNSFLSTNSGYKTHISRFFLQIIWIIRKKVLLLHHFSEKKQKILP